MTACRRRSELRPATRDAATCCSTTAASSASPRRRSTPPDCGCCGSASACGIEIDADGAGRFADHRDAAVTQLAPATTKRPRPRVRESAVVGQCLATRGLLGRRLLGGAFFAWPSWPASSSRSSSWRPARLAGAAPSWPRRGPPWSPWPGRRRRLRGAARGRVALFAAALVAASATLPSLTAPLTTPLNWVPGRNFGTEVFLTLTVSPVRGLRPVRAARRPSRRRRSR